jgi:hypothetical protein
MLNNFANFCNPLLMRRSLFLVIAVSLYIAGCAPMIPRVHAAFASIPDQTPETRIQLIQSVDVRLSTGYSRKLEAGSIWRLTGHLPQGRVYRSIGAPFTIEGAQVHEAYLVVYDGSLTGFYLPGEHMMSPLSTPIPLSIKGNT